jgi:uncharacterized protein (TIGR00369 family)
MTAPRMTAEDIERLLDEQFPQARGFARLEEVAADRVRLRLEPDDRHLRPGGTVSGPTLMALADTAAYFLVLANRGPVALAVTSSLSIHFLRRPRPGALLAEARPLRLGRSLAVADVRLWSEGDDAPVAQATVTYAIPPGTP